MIISVIALVLLGVGVATHRQQHPRIDVIEACEQLNTFMHDGKRYYCAPWVEEPTAPTPRNTDQETSA